MTAFPAYNLDELSGSPIDQLGQFENILLQGEINGLVNSVPKNESESYDLRTQRIRLQTVSTRLFLLGYLSKKNSPKQIHKNLDKIKEAVVHFQKDANLVQDNWIGDKTWYALDELVSFESELTQDQWFIDGNVKPEVKKVMYRAVHLRLWSLGLHSKKPSPKQKQISIKSLEKFNSILHIFLIKNRTFIADFNYETLKILFNQDDLTYAITKCSKPNSNSFFINLTKGKKRKERKLAQSYIINCARIELWLLGYKVAINGSTNFTFREGSDLYKAIFHFYRSFRVIKLSLAQELALKITPQLFLDIGSAIDSNDVFEQDSASEEIAVILQSSDLVETTNKIEEAWAYIKEKGVRLWDGLKRIWRWIKKIGKKAAEFIQQNIFKAFYRYASKTYKILVKGLSAVVESFGVYFKGSLVLPGIEFNFSKDMDTLTLISEAITRDEANLGISKLLKQSKAFNLGCKIVGFIFYIFKNLSLGLFGWAKLLYALLKSYKSIINMYEDLKLLSESAE